MPGLSSPRLINWCRQPRPAPHDATEASLQAILTGRSLLLIISLVSIAVAGLVAWLLVGRVLVHRIGLLSAWMRRMSAGDLEAEEDVGGHDEIADMAAAVEVFRRHALEVQRLNLVELLAQDLQEKNEEIQAALEDLRRAQDQIVTQQKLASLGELTAGVAHEIRNPLNFVKNFSESSAELLVELKEVLEEVGDDLSDDQKGADSGNLRRPERQHGAHPQPRRPGQPHRPRYADDEPGRPASSNPPTSTSWWKSTPGWPSTAPAPPTPTSSWTCNLTWTRTWASWKVIPQDLGRVFLNMVSNSCYATNEKRVELTEKGESFFPALRLTTRRLDEAIQVSVRDNGNGMPPDVVEKIFNPFFTTKPH